MAAPVDIKVMAVNDVVAFEREIQKTYENGGFYIGAQFNYPQKYQTAWINSSFCQNLLSELLSTKRLSYSDNGTYIVLG